MKYRNWAASGCLIAGVAGAGAVAAAAWAAHGLADNPVARNWVDTASRMQSIHAVAVLAVSLAGLTGALPPAARYCLGVAGVLFTVGMIAFCGTLYTLAVSGTPPFPGSAPLGGTALILGWLAVGAAGGAILIPRRTPEA